MIAYATGSMAFAGNFGYEIYPWGNPGIIINPLIMSYAIITQRLMDFELLAKEAMAKVFAVSLVAVPLLAGTMCVQSLITMTGIGLVRTVATLGVSIISSSLAIFFMRNYEDQRTRRLSQFFLGLCFWNAGELLLVMPASSVSVVLYRLVYAIGCVVLVAWFKYWRAYFDRNELWTALLEKVLRYSAYAMMAFCVFTPYVLKTLVFDPTRQTPALEVAGPALPCFWGWFLLALSIISAWTIHAFVSVQKRTSQVSSRWILGAFGFGTAAAISYFAYVERMIRFPLHAFLEIGLCVCLAASLLKRYGKALWIQRKVSPWLGATCLVYPFAAGALLTQGIYWRVTGVILLVVTMPDILREVQGAVQSFLDSEVFKNQLAGRQHVLETRQQSFRLSNLRDLVDTSIQHAVEQLPISSISLYFHNLTSNQYLCITQWPESASQPAVFGEGDPLLECLQKGSLVENELFQLPAGFTAVLPLCHETGLFGFLLLGEKQEALGRLRRNELEEMRQTLEHPLRYAYVFYEQSIMLDKMTHDNIRYAGNIRRFIAGLVAVFNSALPSRVQDILRMIDQQALMMEEYLNDLRRIMSILAQRMQGQYKMEAYDAVMILEQILPVETVRAAQQKIDFSCNIDPAQADMRGRYMGWGEWNSIRHVIENLLSNAFKFTPAGGAIRLEIKEMGPHLEWVVSDTGPGIPKVSLPHIFDLFYQGPGRESMEKSTGLGLSIVKEIVALHGGNIDVISQEKQGTTFYVRVPSAAGQKANAA